MAKPRVMQLKYTNGNVRTNVVTSVDVLDDLAVDAHS